MPPPLTTSAYVGRLGSEDSASLVVAALHSGSIIGSESISKSSTKVGAKSNFLFFTGIEGSVTLDLVLSVFGAKLMILGSAISLI